MKLLIIAQKVDINDDIFGFFHHWIEKFSERLDVVNVICLQSGEYSLLSNVKVFSLGKERGRSRIRSSHRFYKYIWQLRKNYDAIFVHMNPIYVVLGGIFWKLWQKKIYLWHNHRHGNLVTRLAIKISDVVFYTSPFSFAAKFEKSKIMPAGIDTDIFKKNKEIQKIPNSILSLGRISPVKKLEILIEAVKLLDREGRDFILNIVGEKEEGAQDYFKKIKNLARELEEGGRGIKFLGKIPNYQTPKMYNQNEVFINLTPAGSLDKTILEAMACQSIPVLFNKSLAKDLPEFLILKELNAQELKNKILEIFNMKEKEKAELGRKLRNFVIQNHNLDNLIERLDWYFHENIIFN